MTSTLMKNMSPPFFALRIDWSKSLGVTPDELKKAVQAVALPRTMSKLSISSRNLPPIPTWSVSFRRFDRTGDRGEPNALGHWNELTAGKWVLFFHRIRTRIVLAQHDESAWGARLFFSADFFESFDLLIAVRKLIS